jgi:hypothetical protein
MVLIPLKQSQQSKGARPDPSAFCRNAISLARLLLAVGRSYYSESSQLFQLKKSTLNVFEGVFSSYIP